MMNKLSLAAALMLSTAAVGAAHADSVPAPSPSRSADEPGHHRSLLQSWFGGGDHDGEGERHRHRHRHWDDDDDDDDGGSRHARGGGAAPNPADPNASSAPVPNNGVFTNKSRPKVEVQ